MDYALHLFRFGPGQNVAKASDRPDPHACIEGTRIHRAWSRTVVKCETEHGVVVKKIQFPWITWKSEGYMIAYAREVAGMKVPAFRGFEVHDRHHIIKTDFVPAESLDRVWNHLTYQNKVSLRNELKEQIQRMRRCTAKQICCANQNGKPDPGVPIPDPYNRCQTTARLQSRADERAFDADKIRIVEKRDGARRAALIREKISQFPGTYSGRFVLTHGDLWASNILVRDVNKDDPGKSSHYILSAIIDWQTSAFFPEYMEYAILKTHRGYDWWWKKFMGGILEEIGAGCSQARLDIEDLARDRL